MEENLFYLVDNCRVLFWKKGCDGYTPNLSEAQQFTEEEMLKHVKNDTSKHTVAIHYSDIAVLNNFCRMNR